MTALDIIRLNRSEGMGSSDAKRIMDGDWHALYMEKVGLTEPDDLSDVFRVQLGILTEAFHVQWQARKHGVAITTPEVRYYHPTLPTMFAHFDGWITEHDTFVEAKHTRSGASLREKAIYYMPQLQHGMAVADRKHCYFSIIAGNDEPEWAVVERNEEYVGKLIDMEQAFWWHVESRVPPEISPTGRQAEAKRLANTIKVDGLRGYDMTSNNQWAMLACDLIAYREAATLFDAARKQIKDLVPADAAECSGHGLVIKRAKNGSLRFA